eukprot:5796871-Prymnesium_polylepis.1
MAAPRTRSTACRASRRCATRRRGRTSRTSTTGARATCTAAWSPTRRRPSLRARAASTTTA